MQSAMFNPLCASSGTAAASAGAANTKASVSCAADDTCVLCNACYSASDHTGHEVYFYHAHAGGCCDCGDPDAWQPDGFCDKHGANHAATSTAAVDRFAGIPPRLLAQGQRLLPVVVDFIVNTARECLASHVEKQPAAATMTLREAVAPVFNYIGAQVPADTNTNNGGNNDNDNADTNGSDGAGAGAGAVDAMETGDVAISATADAAAAADTAVAVSDEQLMNAILPVPPAVSAAAAEYEVTGTIQTVLHASDYYEYEHVQQCVLSAIADDSARIVSDKSALALHVTVYSTAARLCYHNSELSVVLVSKGEAVLTERPESDIETVLKEAIALANYGLTVSCRSAKLRNKIAAAVQCVAWLRQMCGASDATCSLVGDAFTDDKLHKLMAADMYLPRSLSAPLHDLYMALMADQRFKASIAASYIKLVPDITSDFAQGIGYAEHSLQALSVQFLNRSAFVNELVEHNDLLKTLSRCLKQVLHRTDSSGAFRSATAVALNNLSEKVLQYRRYLPVVADLKCVLNIQGVPLKFAQQCYSDWVDVLTMMQGMDGHRQQLGSQHVEYESRTWMHAFNIGISISTMYDLVVR
eukprot:11505-Heterococcus_DN1.PRE.1